jgi:hypothetical protein
MAKYKVLQKSFINGSLVEADAVVEYDGNASGNLELIEEVADPKKGKKAAAVDDDELPPGSA